MAYGPEIKLEAKRMYVYEGMTSLEISKVEGMPSHGTISLWASTKNELGQDWDDERQQFQQEKFNLMSPAGVASKLLKRIEATLFKDDFSTKDADAVAKLQKTMDKIVDKRLHLHIMYDLLKDEIQFFHEHYPNLINKELLDAIKHFKNELLKRLNNGR